jgi:hypothetical protein
MAATQITVQNITKATSLTPSFEAANADGNYFKNTGKIFVYAKNANVGASRTITIASQVECNQGSTHNVTITVPASSEEMCGSFDVNRFNDSDGYVQMTYDDEADLTLAVISVE